MLDIIRVKDISNTQLYRSLRKMSEEKIKNIFNRLCDEVTRLTEDKLKLIYDDHQYLSVILMEKTYGNEWFVLESYYSRTISDKSEKMKIIYGIIEFFECVRKYGFNSNSLSYARMKLKSLAPLKSIIESQSYEELEIQMTLYGI